MFYDHKSDEIVQNIMTECFCPVLDDIEDEYYNLRRGEFLVIYAPSYVAAELYGRILDEFEDVWTEEESHIELLTQNNADVLITLAYDGMIFVESARGRDGKLMNPEATLSYVYDSFSHKDVQLLSSEAESVLVFGLEDECFDDEDDESECGIDIDCCGCTDEDCPHKCIMDCEDRDKDETKHLDYSKDKDGDLHGFTASKSDGDSYIGYSLYTSDKLSLRDIQSLLQETGF